MINLREVGEYILEKHPDLDEDLIKMIKNLIKKECERNGVRTIEDSSSYSQEIY